MSDAIESRDEIVFIVPMTGGVREPSPADAGGETHGLKEIAGRAVRAFGVKKRSVDAVKDDLKAVLANIRTVLESVEASAVGDLSLEGIDVGLAISGEGSIGIATAGVEASVTLRFTRA